MAQASAASAKSTKPESLDVSWSTLRGWSLTRDECERKIARARRVKLDTLGEAKWLAECQREIEALSILRDRLGAVTERYGDEGGGDEAQDRIEASAVDGAA